MLQELFRIPGINLPIYGYGLMMVIGFFAGAYLAKYLANRVGLNGEHFVNAALIGLVAGVVGARVSHILENIPEFTDASRSAWENIKDMINLRSGGLTFYGGFLLATPVLIGYGIWKKIPIRVGMDIMAPCLMIGLAFGRVGCFLNGCCYGAECNLPIAVEFPYYSNAYIDHFKDQKLTPPPELTRQTQSGSVRLITPTELQKDRALQSIAHAEHSLPVHAAQIYSALNAFLIAAVCLAYFTLPHAAGRVFALMLLLKGVSRFVLEMLRTEPAVVGRGSDTLTMLPPMSISMVISVGLVIGGIAMWVACGKRKTDAGTYAPVPA